MHISVTILKFNICSVNDHYPWLVVAYVTLIIMITHERLITDFNKFWYILYTVT